MRMTCSPVCDLVRFEHIFVYDFWDRSKSRSCTYIFIYVFICALPVRDRMSFDTINTFIVFCRSGTECIWTQYFHCVLLVRDLLFVRRRLRLAQGGYSTTPAFIWPSHSIEWVVWWHGVSFKRRLEASE